MDISHSDLWQGIPRVPNLWLFLVFSNCLLLETMALFSSGNWTPGCDRRSSEFLLVGLWRAEGDAVDWLLLSWVCFIAVLAPLWELSMSLLSDSPVLCSLEFRRGRLIQQPNKFLCSWWSCPLGFTFPQQFVCLLVFKSELFFFLGNDLC